MRLVAFKNIYVYRLAREIKLDSTTVSDALSQFTFTPCASQEMAKVGWVPVLADNLIHEYHGFLLLQQQREIKLLPSHVIKEEVQKKVEKLENEQSRKLKKSEKNTLKDEVLHSLLPRAFTRKSLSR
ncbi:recombination-associated protein RdgC, partial [Escherichia coli]